MNISRRNLLLSTLFGAGAVGLRALATGIPASILLSPRRAFAGDCLPGANPQFIIFNTSGQGDPINANCPGAYVSGVYNCPAATLPTAMATLGTKQYEAAAGWSTLPSDRTAIWHIMTNTVVHPKEPNVLGLNSALIQPDMFPSFLARQLQPCLGTVQPQPISIGATTPSEGLTYKGAALPIIPPSALQDTLANSGILSSANLLKVRDATLSQLNSVYLKNASPAQADFVQSLVTSEGQVRALPDALLSNLSQIATIKDDPVGQQIIAAIVLIQMKISPLVSIHIPFGGDNHHDQGLATEGTETQSGLASLNSLVTQLGTNMMPNTSTPLSDLVTIMSLNVFGRTLNDTNTDGRQHNLNHHVSFVIGKPFAGGVWGGIGPVAGDYGCIAIDPTSGAGVAPGTGGAIAPVDTLTAFAMTVAQGVGIDPTIVQSSLSSSSVYQTMGGGTAKVVEAALSP
jgi:hypothetical protein